MSMVPPTVERLTGTRIPTKHGEFTLSLYENSDDDKDHLALIYGEIGEEDVPVRIHSECFTGDVLGSLRCDCGQQLEASLRQIAAYERGIILYLRQEGRGIGLLDKLRAYDLQDEGYDTVEANHLLGHETDERDYSIGASILQDLNVSSVHLLTNNPEKIESLEQHGIRVEERVPLGPHLTGHNTDYLRTKVNRMRHMLDLGSSPGSLLGARSAERDLDDLASEINRTLQNTERPFVTLTYAQSLDGSIAQADGLPLSLSGEKALTVTHDLRSTHDAILVGIGTVLNDDPRLNVRRSDGRHPRPVVLDSRLRFPLDARLLDCEGPAPIICTNPPVDDERRSGLENRGALVHEVVEQGADGVSPAHALRYLRRQGLRSVMVEGGRSILTSFLREKLVDKVIVTVAPRFVGGVTALEAVGSTSDNDRMPHLDDLHYYTLGNDLLVEGTPRWDSGA